MHIKETTMSDPSMVDDADLIAWLDERLDRTRAAEVGAALAGSAELRDLLFDLAMGPPSAFRRRFEVGAAGAGGAVPDEADYRIDGPFGGLRAAMDGADRSGDDDLPPVYDAAGRVDVILRPGRRRAGAPPTALFVAYEDGPCAQVAVPIEVASNGAMRVLAPAATLFMATGRYTLALAIEPSDPGRFEGLRLAECRALDPSVRWLAADCFYAPGA